MTKPYNSISMILK